DPRVATIGERIKHRDVSSVLMSRCYEVAATLTTAEAMARLERENVPCGVVLSPAELATDPHVAAIGLPVDDDHPVVGQVRLPRPRAQSPSTPAALATPGAPALGQHTDEVLAELGLDAAALREAGVVP